MDSLLARLFEGDDSSFYARVAAHGDELISDEDFADCYSAAMGRPSILLGAMSGMLLVGVPPASAIRLPMVVMYLLLGGNAFAALVAGKLTVGRLFTADHPLVRSVRRAG